MADKFRYLSPQDFNKLGPAAKKRYLEAFFKRHLQTGSLSRPPVQPEQATNNSAG